MLDFPRVLISVTAALIATLALFWSERGIIYEFGYPRDGGPMGYVSLLKVYVVLGWLFAMIGTLLKIEGTSTANAAAAAGLAGALFAGILRFYAMSRTFSLGQTLTSPPLVNEILLLSLTLLFGVIVVIIGIGSFGPYMVRLAPTTGGARPQPQSLILLGGSATAALLVELIWLAWTKTNEHARLTDEVGQRSVGEVTRPETGDSGLQALKLFIYLSKSPIVHTVDGLRKDSNCPPVDDVDKAVELLRESGLLVSAVARGFRRHPHFFQAQGRLAQQYWDTLDQINEVTENDVLQLLKRLRKSEWDSDLPSPLKPFLDRDGRPAFQAVPEILGHALERLRDLQGEDAFVHSYLRLRFWERMTVVAMAKEAGYSREHFTRTRRRRALSLFRRVLIDELLP